MKVQIKRQRNATPLKLCYKGIGGAGVAQHVKLLLGTLTFHKDEMVSHALLLIQLPAFVPGRQWRTVQLPEFS